MRLARLLEAAIARACTSRLAVPFVRPLLPLLEDDEGVDEGGDKIGGLASLTRATVLQRTSGDQGGSGIAFRAHGTAST